MTRRSPAIGTLLMAMIVASLFALPATAQAPPPERIVEAVYMDVQIDGELIKFQCLPVTSDDTEASHEETPFAPPPTFTPSVYASPTPSPETTTPTQEIGTPPPPRATLAPKPTVTPTRIATLATTPHSACYGRVLALKGLNVREWGDRNAPDIGDLWYGAIVELFGYVWDSAGDKWYDVRWNDGWGYVHAGWIAPEPACWGLTVD